MPVACDRREEEKGDGNGEAEACKRLRYEVGLMNRDVTAAEYSSSRISASAANVPCVDLDEGGAARSMAD